MILRQECHEISPRPHEERIHGRRCDVENLSDLSITHVLKPLEENGRTLVLRQLSEGDVQSVGEVRCFGPRMRIVPDRTRGVTSGIASVVKFHRNEGGASLEVTTTIPTEVGHDGEEPGGESGGRTPSPALTPDPEKDLLGYIPGLIVAIAQGTTDKTEHRPLPVLDQLGHGVFIILRQPAHQYSVAIAIHPAVQPRSCSLPAPDAAGL